MAAEVPSPDQGKGATMSFMGKIRPQIFLAILVLGLLSGVGVWQNMSEIATGCVGGIIALGMKVLEAE